MPTDILTSRPSEKNITISSIKKPKSLFLKPKNKPAVPQDRSLQWIKTPGLSDDVVQFTGITLSKTITMMTLNSKDYKT